MDVPHLKSIFFEKPKEFIMKLHTALLALFVSSHVYAAGEKSLHEFTVNNIHGEPVDLSTYKGKVVLIVNTASRCGFTRQYADLVSLQEAYADKGFVVLGFPANNFGNQEPGSDAEILEFCESNYDVNFPMFSKISVRGDDQHPLFQWLTNAENESFTGNIRWNFEKFLVDQDGNLVQRFRSMTNPNSPNIRNAIGDLLEGQEG